MAGTTSTLFFVFIVLSAAAAAAAAATQTDVAIDEAYAHLVNITGNQEFWAERTEDARAYNRAAYMSDPVLLMDRFNDGEPRPTKAPAATRSRSLVAARRLGPGSEAPWAFSASDGHSGFSASDGVSVIRVQRRLHRSTMHVSIHGCADGLFPTRSSPNFITM
ncbi:unnamed protein product [Urochloa humidicola]